MEPSGEKDFVKLGKQFNEASTYQIQEDGYFLTTTFAGNMHFKAAYW